MSNLVTTPGPKSFSITVTNFGSIAVLAEVKLTLNGNSLKLKNGLDWSVGASNNATATAIAAAINASSLNPNAVASVASNVVTVTFRTGQGGVGTSDATNLASAISAESITAVQASDGDQNHQLQLYHDRTNGRIESPSGTVQMATTSLQVLGGVATATSAGAPTDASVVNPVNGMLVVDTTDNKIYCRIGGAWKSVAVS